MEFLFREDQTMDGMCRHGSFGKTTENKLELVLVGCDITNGEDPLLPGFAGGGVNQNMPTLQRKPPIGNWPKVSCKTIKGEQNVSFQRPLVAFQILDNNGIELTVFPREAMELIGNNHLDLAAVCKRPHAGN